DGHQSPQTDVIVQTVIRSRPTGISGIHHNKAIGRSRTNYQIEMMVSNGSTGATVTGRPFVFLRLLPPLFISPGTLSPSKRMMTAEDGECPGRPSAPEWRRLPTYPVWFRPRKDGRCCAPRWTAGVAVRSMGPGGRRRRWPRQL